MLCVFLLLPPVCGQALVHHLDRIGVCLVLLYREPCVLMSQTQAMAWIVKYSECRIDVRVQIFFCVIQKIQNSTKTVFLSIGLTSMF